MGCTLPVLLLENFKATCSLPVDQSPYKASGSRVTLLLVILRDDLCIVKSGSATLNDVDIKDIWNF